MTPEAMKAAQKMIADAFKGILKVKTVWRGQLDGCDVFAIHSDSDTPLLLGYPQYAFVDPKKTGKFVCICDDDLVVTRRLKEAEEKAQSKAAKP